MCTLLNRLVGVVRRQLPLLLLVLLANVARAELPSLTAVTLRYGTANWELQTIKRRGLDVAHGFELIISEVNSPSASSIALQADAADVGVQDWLWITRQRAAGKDLRFAPFSSAVGSLMVPADSDVRSLGDIAGITLGVAGGDSDKGWRLLNVLMARVQATGQESLVAPKFGAPPLLNQLALRGDLDGVLTYWHYAARLSAQNFRTLISVKEMLLQLGVEQTVPMLGWCFAGDTIRAGKPVEAFLAAAREARRILSEEPGAWEAIAPWVRAGSQTELEALKAGYVLGAPGDMTPATVEAIEAVAALYQDGAPGEVQLDPAIFQVSGG